MNVATQKAVRITFEQQDRSNVPGLIVYGLMGRSLRFRQNRVRIMRSHAILSILTVIELFA